MNKTIIQSAFGDKATKIVLDCGLTILMYPMKDFSSAYALLGTKYGSINSTFKTQKDADFVTVPNGIAHFLEHKLFENEDGDAFAEYAKTGASANAFTSFTKTCYEFSTSQNFKESLDILMKTVTKPFFTEQTVQKEQGIIAQEIKMYDDMPAWVGFNNLMECLFVDHPIKINIAGTVDSISNITADLLYYCYNTFYSINNLVLSIAGNFSPDDVLEVVDRYAKPCENVIIERKAIPFAGKIAKPEAVATMEISTPIFNIGYLHKPYQNLAKGRLVNNLLVDILFNQTSDFYRNLYDAGLINSDFDCEVLSESDAVATLFSGESSEPYKVFEAIKAEIARVKKEGIDPYLFEINKKAFYSRLVRLFQNVEAMATLMINNTFNNLDIFGAVDIIANLSLEDITDYLQNNFDDNLCAISIVKSK